MGNRGVALWVVGGSTNHELTQMLQQPQWHVSFRRHGSHVFVVLCCRRVRRRGATQRIDSQAVPGHSVQLIGLDGDMVLTPSAGDVVSPFCCPATCCRACKDCYQLEHDPVPQCSCWVHIWACLHLVAMRQWTYVYDTVHNLVNLLSSRVCLLDTRRNGAPIVSVVHAALVKPASCLFALKSRSVAAKQLARFKSLKPLGNVVRAGMRSDFFWTRCA